jgi:type IV pilus assembly protein PilY1
LTGLYRARASILGDIIDSSPTWVGPPNAALPAVWSDLIHSTSVPAENATTAVTYTTFASTGTAAQNKEQQRTNVVYAGANDGFLHGFRSGSFDSSNAFIATQNDGKEVMAYMPGYTLNTIQNATNTQLNFSDPQYGHKFDVDAPPGTGDLFYQGKWHSWLVGGLGPGGKAIYALDVTDPDGKFGTEATASTTVMGEWSTVTGISPGPPVTITLASTTMNCVGDGGTPCGNNLGNTYGIPQIRRFHNGRWGAVFGNGLGSVSGDAGIFVMLVSPTAASSANPNAPAITFHYLSTATGSAGSPNGIVQVTAADFDGDHITDYVYAGDIQGNVWRFDLTSTAASTWGSATKIFTTNGGSTQPITTKIAVISAGGTGSPNPHLLLEFGTGQQVPMSNLSAATYKSGTVQALYGVWDWNLSGWNSQSSTQQFAVLGSHALITGYGSLTPQSITLTVAASGPGTTDLRTVSSTAVCYADISGCTQFGWYLPLTSGNVSSDPAVPTTGVTANAANPVVYEQVIFSPVVQSGAFIVNTTVPPSTAPTMCFSSDASGWTMALNPATGGAFTNAFFGDANNNFLTTAVNGSPTPVSGVALAGTGTPSIVQSGTQNYLITQTVSGNVTLKPTFPQGNTQGKRLTWIQKR